MRIVWAVNLRHDAIRRIHGKLHARSRMEAVARLQPPVHPPSSLLMRSLGLFTLLASCLGAVPAAELAAAADLRPVALVSPADQAVLYTTVPAFQWDGAAPAQPERMGAYVIQVAADREFRRLVDEDRLAAVIRWYVPDRELPLGRHWWRVAAADHEGRAGPWSEARSFDVKPAEREMRIRAGATWPEIKRTFAAAMAEKAPVRISFDRAEYRLDPGPDRILFEFTRTNDLVVDGGGSTFVITHPVSWITLRECRRVLIKNCTLDMDPPAYTAARVLEVKDGAIETEILTGHSLPDDYPAYARDRKGMVVTPADGFAMKRGIQLVVTHAGFERMAGRRYRFRFERPETARLFSPGDVYVLDPRWLADGGGHGAVVYGGEDAVFLKLAIRTAANECLGSFYANRHAILHVRLERKDGRALSVNNGGHNHHNARLGPWIEGCLFENTGDDVCHVNGYAMGIAAQPAADRLVFHRRQPYDQYSREAALDLRPGDRLEFFQQSSGRVQAEARVVSTRAEANTVEVRIDRPVTGLVIGALVSAPGVGHAASRDPHVTQVFNASRGCNQFVFRHSVARNSRRVGVLAKGDGGLIEHNRFENLGGGGVEFWNAPFEGLGAVNYVVRDNRIVDCGRLDREHAGIWATMFKSGGDRRHRHLLIERNEIVNFPMPAMLLRDVEDAVVRDNRIEAAAPNRRGREPAEPVVQRNTANVRAEGNEITRP